MDINAFALQFNDEVINEAKYGLEENPAAEDFKENAFTRIFTGDLDEAGALESPQVCHLEFLISGHPAKVNAYAIPDDDSRLDIVIADYHLYDSGEIPKIIASDVDRYFKMAVRFLNYILEDGRRGAVDPGSKAFGMIYDITSRKDSYKRIQITLISNRILAVRKEKLRTEKIGNLNVGYEIWDLQRLMRFRSGSISHEPIEVDMSNYPGGGLACLSIADPAMEYSTSLALLPGKVLADWYDEYGARLLELNVRSYLQARGKINKGILTTLIKEPDRFLSYNNGVTIVAEEIIFTPDQSRIKGLRGLQIVNGGQTTASIHRAKSENNADLSHVYVQAKITKVPAEKFEVIVPEISRLSNTQNKVTDVDLRAGDYYHVGVARVADKKWTPGEKSKWFYERTRGSYETERSRRSAGSKANRDKFDREFPVNQKITKEDLAKASNSFNGFPHFVSKGGQKNFLKFMETVPKVSKDWEPDEREFKEIIGKCILFRSAYDVAKRLKKSAFRGNIVTYTVAALCHATSQNINFGKIWELQDIEESWKEQLESWMPQVEELLVQGASGRNPGEWFKSEQCWNQIKTKISEWKLNADLEKEVSLETSRYAGQDHSGDPQTCMQLDAHHWVNIYQWGEQSEQLTRYQLDISRKLSELAFGNWEKAPPDSLAKTGVEIINLYKSLQTT